MGGIGVSQSLVPERYPENGGYDEFYDEEEPTKFIASEGLKVLGKGAEGTAYALDENRILKIYNNQDFSQVEAWYRNISLVDDCGIRCAKAYELVRVENGYGIVFERLKGRNLGWTINENPDKLETLAEKMGLLLKNIHATKDPTHTFESVTERMKKSLDIITEKKMIGNDQRQMVMNFLDAVSERDTLIHGDFHEGNILVDENEELVLIDLDRVGVGHPIYDLIGNYLNHEAMIARNPDFALRSWGLDAKRIMRIKRIMLETYFGTSDMAVLDEYSETIKDAFTLRCVLLPATKIFGMDESAAKAYISDKFEKLQDKISDLSDRVNKIPV